MKAHPPVEDEAEARGRGSDGDGGSDSGEDGDVLGDPGLHLRFLEAVEEEDHAGVPFP